MKAAEQKLLARVADAGIIPEPKDRRSAEALINTGMVKVLKGKKLQITPAGAFAADQIK